MVDFSRNPIYRRLQASARRDFDRSPIGQLVGQLSRGAGSATVDATLKRAATELHRPPMQAFRGTDLGRFATEIQRYSRGGGYRRKIVAQVLGSMGPAGKLIQALIGSGGASKRDVEKQVSAAFDFLRIFQPELLSPAARKTRRPGRRGSKSAAEAESLAKLLEAQGYKIIRPGKGKTQAQQMADMLAKQGYQVTPPGGAQQQGRQRKTVDIDVGGRSQRFPRNHPIVTGEMLPTPSSSNVHSYGYDSENWYLYVRFKAAAPRGSKSRKRPQSPGSLYRYSNVPPEKFLSMYAADRKGSWIWDNIRVRGTWSGHQYDYALVGVTGGYVPRKATYTPKGEYFLPRIVRGQGGRRLTSSLPAAPAPPLSGAPNTGAPPPPNTGAP